MEKSMAGSDEVTTVHVVPGPETDLPPSPAPREPQVLGCGSAWEGEPWGPKSREAALRRALGDSQGERSFSWLRQHAGDLRRLLQSNPIKIKQRSE